MKYSLPELPYRYDALEPYYDRQTLRIHHDTHHKAYVDGLNNAQSKLEEARGKGDYSLIKHWERELAFHGSGHILHTLFWESMSPDASGKPTDSLAQQIITDFGSYEAFKEHFISSALTVEGSGWTVLGWNPAFDKLEILQVEKHQNLTLWGLIPVLVIDVWEHAYYLSHQNRRLEYINSWWNIANWNEANKKLINAKR